MMLWWYFRNSYHHNHNCISCNCS